MIEKTKAKNDDKYDGCEKGYDAWAELERDEEDHVRKGEDVGQGWITKKRKMTHAVLQHRRQDPEIRHKRMWMHWEDGSEAQIVNSVDDTGDDNRPLRRR